MIAPSGKQVTIVAKDQQAVIVEVGGGLRSYSVGGRELLDGYGADEMSSSGRGQVLIPWPNRLEDGSYEFNGRRYQLPLNEAEHRNAIHGLVRWSTWTATQREPHRLVMEHILYPQPGYPFLLGISIEYALSDSGLQVRTTATNLGTQSCPYGSGAHPYLTLGAATIDDFAYTWANGPAVRRARPSDPEGSRRRNRLRFSPAETDRLDKARPRIYRP
jgi:aldose 1-epimerase